MRRPTSCTACRARRKACAKLAGSKQCKSCTETGRLCSLAAIQGSAATRQPIRSLGGADDNEDKAPSFLLADQDVTHLVETYFYYIHDRPHSLFHQATLWSTIKQGSAGKALLYSICSLASTLSPRLELQRLGPQLASYAKRHLLDNLENVSLQNVQASILLANVSAAELMPSSEALFFGMSRYDLLYIMRNANSG